MVIPPHPDLAVGPWQAEVIGARKVRLTSLPDKPTGVQLVREFALAKDSAPPELHAAHQEHLGNAETWCHWSRTLAVGDGICVIPLTPDSRFPNNYIMYGPGTTINYKPTDKQLTPSAMIA